MKLDALRLGAAFGIVWAAGVITLTLWARLFGWGGARRRSARQRLYRLCRHLGRFGRRRPLGVCGRLHRRILSGMGVQPPPARGRMTRKGGGGVAFFAPETNI